MEFGNALPIAVAVFIGVLVLMSLWARRDELIYNFRVLAVGALVGLGVFSFCMSKPEFQEVAPVAGAGTVLFIFLLRPKRKRKIKASTRRRAIAKWELKTGKKFNSRFHEVDHTVPFSQGGNETVDNLRVVDKKTNRSKGAKSAWWDVLGRR